MIKNDSIELHCELCGKSTNVTLKLGDLIDKLPALKPEGEMYLHGICQRCQVELDEGCVFFCDKNRRVVKVSLEASLSKIDPQFHGKVIRVPEAALDELIRAWAQVNHPPPASNN